MTTLPLSSPCLHADRAPGRDRDHRRLDRPAAARRAGGPRGGPADAVRQQPEAARDRDPQLHLAEQLLRPPGRELRQPGLWRPGHPERLAAGLGGYPAARHGAAALYNTANYSESVNNSADTQTLCATRVNTLLCPSESMPTGPFYPNSWINYAANFGGPATMASWSGPIVYMANSVQGTNDSSVQIGLGLVGVQSVTDGTSNTAMFSERLIGIVATASVTPTSGQPRAGSASV